MKLARWHFTASVVGVQQQLLSDDAPPLMYRDCILDLKTSPRWRRASLRLRAPLVKTLHWNAIRTRVGHRMSAPPDRAISRYHAGAVKHPSLTPEGPSCRNAASHSSCDGVSVKVDWEKWWRNELTSRFSRGQKFRAGGSTAAFTSSFCCFQYRFDPRRGQMLFQQQPNQNIKKHERISSNCCAAVSPSYLSDGVKQVTSWRPQQKSIFIKSLHDSFKVYL